VTVGNLKWLSLLGLACLFCYGNARSLRGVRDLALAMNIVEQVYVEPTDPKKLYEAAMTGMLKSLDANTSYIAQEHLPSFESIFDQEFGGLGLSLDGPPRRPELTVVATIFNSPAFRAGLRPGDVIARIDGVNVRNWYVRDVSSKLRGREGTSVQLMVDRDGDQIDSLLVRERIEIESVLGDRRRENGTWDFLLEADPRIAYIRIELFGEKTVDEFKKAIDGCKPRPEGIIIDLRDNSGGLLLAAAQICDLFLDDGPIVTTKSRNERIDDELTAVPGTIVPRNCPIAILINENSASASEILAGCLKDRERAAIVGKRSYGKGSVQNVIPIEGGKAAIRLTTAYYYPPSGKRIHRRNQTDLQDWGIDPSPGCEVDLLDEQLEAVVARFRERSQPRPPSHSRQASGGDRAADPSIGVDPQLKFAVEHLQSQLGPSTH
jgi:carboxyl-terminal processing protease